MTIDGENTPTTIEWKPIELVQPPAAITDEALVRWLGTDGRGARALPAIAHHLFREDTPTLQAAAYLRIQALIEQGRVKPTRQGARFVGVPRAFVPLPTGEALNELRRSQILGQLAQEPKTVEQLSQAVFNHPNGLVPIRVQIRRLLDEGRITLQADGHYTLLDDTGSALTSSISDSEWRARILAAIDALARTKPPGRATRDAITTLASKLRPTNESRAAVERCIQAMVEDQTLLPIEGGRFGDLSYRRRAQTFQNKQHAQTQERYAVPLLKRYLRTKEWVSITDIELKFNEQKVHIFHLYPALEQLRTTGLIERRQAGTVFEYRWLHENEPETPPTKALPAAQPTAPSLQLARTNTTRDTFELEPIELARMVKFLRTHPHNLRVGELADKLTTQLLDTLSKV